MTKQRIEEWDADENVFFRVTGKNRLHQEYSFVVGEEFLIRGHWTERLQDTVGGEIRSGNLADAEYDELKANLAEVKASMEKAKRNRDKDYGDDWEAYQDAQENYSIAQSEYADAQIRFDEDFQTLVEETAIQYSDDYLAGSLREIENELGIPMEIEEIYAGGADNLYYPGPNTRLTLDEAVGIASDSHGEQWDWARDMDAPVIHVIRGDAIGDTLDLDGVVIRPEETIAVFEWNEDFEAAILPILGYTN